MNDKTKDDLLIEMQALLQENNSLKESLNKSLTSCKQVEEASAQLNDDILKLNQFAVELSMLSPEEDLKALIIRLIKEFSGATFAMFSDYDPVGRTLTTEHIEMEPGLIGKFVGMVSRNGRQIHSEVNDEMFKYITREVAEVRKTLFDVSFGAIPRPVATAIQALLKVDRFIGIAFLVKGELYGTSLLGMPRDKPDPQMQILKNFVSLASVSLRRKQAEEKIREKDIQFRKLSANVPDLIFQFTRRPDGSYYVPIASEGIKNIFGCSPEDVLNDFTPIGKVIFPEDNERVLSDIEYSAKHLNYFTCEFRVQIPGKGIQWIYSKSTPERLPDGSVTWYGFNTDITERKLAEETLLEKDVLLNITGHTAKVGGWELDVKTMKLKWTEEVYILHEVEFSFEPNVESGTNFYSPSSKIILEKALRKAIEFGEPFDLELEFITHKGNHLWVHSIGVAIQENGEIKKVFGSFQNITEYKLIEQELIKAKENAEESDRLKSAFLANMSHEIRTPMNGILGFSNLLSEPGLESEEQQEYIKIIQKSGARMLNILSEIMDISKIESGLTEVNITQVNINKQVEFVYELLKPDAADKAINFFIKNSLPTNEAFFQTDGEKLYGILSNLVKNAIKYTDKGSVVFGYEITQTNGNAPVLQFYVKDTGIGIPEGRQEAIFERFIQADIADVQARQGAGLGLSIAKAYVEMLGGKIWVESETWKGSTFYFTLPYHSEPEEKNADSKVVSYKNVENYSHPEVHGLKILIAEDDEVSELLISIEVKTFVNLIFRATTGIETVEVCRNNPDLDLILMDIQMPDLNGYEATRQIRQFNKDVVIIAQTAFGLFGDREKAIQAGCNDYISKPIKAMELKTLIMKHIKNLN